MSSTESAEPSSTESTAPPAAVPGPPATVPPGGAPPALREREEVRTVPLRGCSLVVRTRTARRDGLRPGVFVHGLGGSSQNWSALMDRLADTVDGWAVDLPGFGASPPPDDGDYSITGHARAVVRLVEARGAGPVDLFGNSLGGAVATRIAALRPDLVRTLTLISPALPEVPPQATAWPTALVAVPGVPQLYMRATRDWSPRRRTEALIALCYGDPANFGEAEFRAAAEEYRRRLDLPYFWDAMIRSTRGIVDAYTLPGAHSLWRQARHVLAPTLLVYGGRDKLVSVRMARKAAKTFPGACLVVVPDGGHVAMMEHPHVVDRAFRELIAGT
jgi:pimeloyl-ACP methyl ester carboxylesterase